MNREKYFDIIGSFEKRNQDFIISYDTVGEVSMNFKKCETLDKKESFAPITSQQYKEIQFLSGTADMKVLLQDLIACRIKGKYEA